MDLPNPGTVIPRIRNDTKSSPGCGTSKWSPGTTRGRPLNLKGKDGSKQFFALGCNYLTGTETIAVSYRLNFDLGLNFYSFGSQEVRMR